MNELLAGYANYASTESILMEQSLAAPYAEQDGWTLTVSVTVTTICSCTL